MIWKLVNNLKKKINPYKYWKKMGLKTGDNCVIYPSASFGSEPYLVELGNHVRVTSNVSFVTHDGGVWVLREKESFENIDLFGKIVIGNNVHIGTGVTIMPGVKIGNNCIIGCGAIVTKSIPDNSVAVGIPAKVIETIDDYLFKHKNDFDYTKNLSSEQKRNYLMKKFEK